MPTFNKNTQYRKFCAYGFLKNLRFFDAFFILFFIDKGLTYTQIGLLYGLREIVINLFEVPSGIVADTFGRKRALIFALLSYIMAFITFYLGQNFYVFLFAMTLYGVGDAFRSGTNKGMIMDYLRLNNWIDQKVNYYGHTRAWSQKGSAVSSLIAGVLVYLNGDYQFIFLFALLPYFINLLNIWSYPDELNFSSKSKPGQIKSWRETIKNFFYFVRQRDVLRIMNSAAMHSAFMKSLKDYIQPLMMSIVVLIPFLIDEDMTRRSGLIIGVIYFIIYLLTSTASKNAQKLLNLGWPNLSIKTLFLGLSFGALCGVFYIAEWHVAALIFFIGLYIIENLRKPILTGEMADQVSGDVLTSVLSAQSFMQSLLTISLSIVFGLLADRFGIGFGLLALSMILLFISIAIHSIARNSHQPKNI